MKNNRTLYQAAPIAAMLLMAGQVSAHVSYGPPLYDDTGTANSTVMHLSSTNVALGVKSTQTLTVTSNAGYAETKNATLWANSHDNKFMWLYVSRPTDVHIHIDGLANSPYVSTMNGSALKGVPTPIDTLNPGFNLFYGAVPYLSHDGAYGAFNTGFAPWSSWAQQAAPIGTFTEGAGSTRFVGVGNLNSEGNPIQGLSYTVDAGSANLPGATIPAGTTGHMGTYGGFLVPGAGPAGEKGFWMANNAGQVTYADGTPLTQHSAFLQFYAHRATSGNSLDADITLKKAGVYTLIIGGNNGKDAMQLVKYAMMTGMGPESCAVDANGNCITGSTANATRWDFYKNVARRPRNFTITVTGTPH